MAIRPVRELKDLRTPELVRKFNDGSLSKSDLFVYVRGQLHPQGVLAHAILLPPETAEEFLDWLNSDTTEVPENIQTHIDWWKSQYPRP